MKPSPLELLVYKLDKEYKDMRACLIAAYIQQHKAVPNPKEFYLDGKKVFFLTLKKTKHDEFSEMMGAMILEMQLSPEHNNKESAQYWATCKINPDEAVLIQELSIADNEIIITNSYQFKNQFVLPQV